MAWNDFARDLVRHWGVGETFTFDEVHARAERDDRFRAPLPASETAADRLERELQALIDADPQEVEMGGYGGMYRRLR